MPSPAPLTRRGRGERAPLACAYRRRCGLSAVAAAGTLPPWPTTLTCPTISRAACPTATTRALVCDDCGFVSYENPKVVVGSVCTWGDRILLCRRAIEPREASGRCRQAIWRCTRPPPTAPGAKRTRKPAPHRDRGAAGGLQHSAHQPGAGHLPRPAASAPTSPPVRRARRSGSSPGTRSPGPTSPSPACAGRCSTSARCATSRPSRRAATRPASTATTERRRRKRLAGRSYVSFSARTVRRP